MRIIHAVSFLLLLVTSGIPLLSCNNSTGKERVQTDLKEVYQCTPCGYDCDTTIYYAAGKCPHCSMALVKKSTIHFNNIPATEVCQYIKDHPGIILLDVRTAEEFEGKANPDFGSLKNAINIPVQELINKLTALAPYKQKEILVYCSHSHRSPQASYILTQNGFTNVVNMAGGMSILNDDTCKQ